VKTIWGVLLIILLAACTPPSQPQYEATAMVYVLQTQAAIPTNIPPPAETNTSLPVTMPPTWTPLASEDNLSSHVCKVNGPYPDPACTPGAVFEVTAVQVCVSGYSSSVRNVPESLKDQVYASYGIINRSPGQYEVDHLIPLELGGSNDIKNLFPEAASPKPGFHEKDKVENYLHDQVCDGRIDLQLAQDIIRDDWVKVYNSLSAAIIPTSQIDKPQVTSTSVKLQPTSVSIPTKSKICCKVCSAGKPCGDSCISKNYNCTKPPGCACQGP
jgi:hypothetical protein